MTFNKKLLAATLVTVAGLTAVSSANAETDTGAFDVELDVTKTCDVTSAVGVQKIDFTSYAAGQDVQEASSAAAISVLCSKGTTYNIGLLGSGFLYDGVDTATANKVAYQLLKTTGGTVWGNTATEVGSEGTGMANDQAISHTVYASLVAGSTANLPVGTYTDNVVVTLTY